MWKLQYGVAMIFFSTWHGAHDDMLKKTMTLNDISRESFITSNGSS